MIDDRSRRALGVILPGDYRELDRRYTVRYDNDDRTVVLDDIELPPGWEPRTITVRIKLPPHYPHTWPRWEFPGTIRRDGAVPRRLLVAGNWLVRGTLGDPWIYWPRDWDPQRSSLADETERAVTELTGDPESGSDSDAEPDFGSVDATGGDHA